MFDRTRRLMKGESNIDFIGRSRIWLIVSIVVVVVSLIGLVGRQFNLGLEFSGGTSLTVPTEKNLTADDVESALSSFDIGSADVQISTSPGGGREVRVRAEQIEDRNVLVAVQTALARVAGQTDSSGQPDPDAVAINDVGPSWGRQISNKALRGLIVFLVLVSIYISLRFEWKMAVGALAALVHDLLSTAGVYTLAGIEVTPATVIALLTLMGFSLYDTVVVFDKVRENQDTLTATGKTTYTEMVNRSMNQVLVRSINTSLSSVMPVAGLLFVGVYLFKADTLKDLAVAMFIGTLVSTYSSIFVASPLLVWLKEKEPRYQQLRSRLAGGRGARVSPTVATATATATAGPAIDMDTDEDEVAETPARPQPRPGQYRPPPRGRKRRGGKRRR
ncbi:MAG: protein translocase subunit SecF [Actinomycetota bacterium]